MTTVEGSCFSSSVSGCISWYGFVGGYPAEENKPPCLILEGDLQENFDYNWKTQSPC